MYDICIIGGGASGMTAAIEARRERADLSICILEKKDRPGRKLCATGSGRCNLTNAARDDKGEVRGFFYSLGVLTREEAEGRVYPVSGSAADVVRALECALEAAGVEVRCEQPVTEVRREEDGTFSLRCGSGVVHARRLVLACGGKAGPQYGCSGDGYRFARHLGHSTTRLYPVLTGIECELDPGVRGVRCDGTVQLLCRGALAAEESGQIQFGADGLSGICVMNLSRFLRLDDDLRFADYTLRLILRRGDQMPLLEERRRLPGLTAADLLLSIVPSGLAHWLLQLAGVPRDLPINAIDDSRLRRTAALLTAFDLPVRGARGWKQAQCTGGGIPAAEIDTETMASRRCPGLYLAGELLDYDGPCGGFNLDHAWRSGRRAGKAAAHAL
jgi:predicted Rossmann fold flavoprotein